MDGDHQAKRESDLAMSDWDQHQAARLAAEAVAAGGLGILGALARIAAAGEDQPMLRKALLFRIVGDASMGLGLWLALHAMGYAGWWTMFAAWAGGALGYAVVHDLALRLLNKKIGQ